MESLGNQIEWKCVSNIIHALYSIYHNFSSNSFFNLKINKKYTLKAKDNTYDKSLIDFHWLFKPRMLGNVPK
jgi:hypothetical protein